MSDIEETQVTKSGETILTVQYQRASVDPKAGLRLTLKARPDIEDFFSLQLGDKQPVSVLGRYWSAKQGNEDLQVWSVQPQFTGVLGDEDLCQFRLDAPGLPLLFEAEANEDGDMPRRGHNKPPAPKVANISFLRLVGISEGSGVTLNVRGVYSRKEIERIVGRIRAATRAFYEMHLKPINIAVTMNTQEVPMLEARLGALENRMGA